MRRSLCIWLAFAVVFMLALFPPWKETVILPSGYPPRHWKLWHAPFSRPPHIGDRWGSVDVDYPRMLTEIWVGECFVVALYLTWGRTPKS
jgi:hypothetical protein